MIQVRSLAFGVFPEIEAFNRGFSRGHAKLRVTVDTEALPAISDERVLERLTGAFPGLTRHECRAQETAAGSRAAGTQILLIESDPSANQAHLLEHLTLEMLSAIDPSLHRLSGVTCAYASPRERNDVFVECSEPESGTLAALLATETINAGLAQQPLKPLYPDVVQCARVLHLTDGRAWTARHLASVVAIPPPRVVDAFEVLSRARLVEPESFSMNFSGEPYFRLSGAPVTLMH